MSFTTQAKENETHFDYNESEDLVSNPYVEKSDWGCHIETYWVPEYVDQEASAMTDFFSNKL